MSKGEIIMCNDCIHIAIVEQSSIVYEGVANILIRSNQHFQLYKFDSVDELSATRTNQKFDIVIANPSLIQFNARDCNTLKRINPSVKWVALVYSFYGKDVLAQFDEVLQISDTPEFIVQRLANLVNVHTAEVEPGSKEQLSEREIDVLVQLVHGLSNKEIADKLNISIHTVMSHRKNITQKTGIKSQSGLTIYAIYNKIISLDSLAL